MRHRCLSTPGRTTTTRHTKPATAGFTLFEEPDTEEVELGTIELPDEPCPWGEPDYVDRWDCHERTTQRD